MSLNLVNLDDITRKNMLEEIDEDINKGTLYSSNRLSTTGKADYPELLKQAVSQYDDSWLANQLRVGGRMNTTETRKTKSGVTTAKVPVTAPDTLAEGEFNRFYIRGLCLRAINEGVSNLIIYRAKAVSNPRPDSDAKIGTQIHAESLLEDLRNNPGVDTALGLPPGPNSGLSVKLP
jgi:hypothetical protein